MKQFSRSKTAAAIALGISTFVAAHPVQSASGHERNLVVGLGGAYTTTEFHGADSETNAVPILEYQVGRYMLRPIGISALLTTLEWGALVDATSAYQLALSISADYADDKRDNNDSVVFAGMEARELGSTAGLSASLATPVGEFNLALSSDISNSSDGSTASISYGFPLFAAKKLSVNGNIGAAFSNNEFNNYYYGVRDSESTASRTAYSADSAINPFIGISADYAINQHWIVSQSASVTQLDDSIVDSPLTTEDDTRSEFFLGLMYNY